ncbi:MAG: FIST C-terminal domain-containing protein [Gammaproteobacteria bacterium]|nr:FIST C-terminal domain-containing protein [Gammaproteobacteria bacterium]MBU1601396.1 FIST C-terminal domain-containing protein [Gammaproteobacteria bacterium]MBU2433591.1 FIST C-terminal domain-containing protein [Gammaproteobacteria bacterium]MBU2449872.1 FIST C-terminal domain-containing protein [Gammaproteobacteria bacterium]
MTTDSPFRISHSSASEARQAAREFHAGVDQPGMSVVIFFCSSDYDLDALADELNRLFGSVPLIGCTTAGEIGSAGYRNQSLSGVSFSADAGAVVAGSLPDLQHFEAERGQAFVQGLLQQLDKHVTKDSRAFALLLIDGLSVREEPVVRVLQGALGSIHLCGGSAGDDLKFASTQVFHDGAFRDNSAVLLLVSTPLPIRIFKTQHFISENERLVVTDADAEHRIVKEINGLPAAEEYARVLGVSVEDLTPDHFAATPVVVVLDGTDYVRSIQKVNPDGTLTFFCAIEDGIVLRVARCGDIYANLEQTFDNLREEIGQPALTLGCDCILRNLEITQKQLKGKIGELFQRHNTVGFSTYGEQFGGVHINQTFTGIAIGFAPEEKHD